MRFFVFFLLNYNANFPAHTFYSFFFAILFRWNITFCYYWMWMSIWVAINPSFEYCTVCASRFDWSTKHCADDLCLLSGITVLQLSRPCAVRQWIEWILYCICICKFSLNGLHMKCVLFEQASTCYALTGKSYTLPRHNVHKMLSNPFALCVMWISVVIFFFFSQNACATNQKYCNMYADVFIQSLFIY